MARVVRWHVVGGAGKAENQSRGRFVFLKSPFESHQGNRPKKISLQKSEHPLKICTPSFLVSFRRPPEAGTWKNLSPGPGLAVEGSVGAAGANVKSSGESLSVRPSCGAPWGHRNGTSPLSWASLIIRARALEISDFQLALVRDTPRRILWPRP